MGRSGQEAARDQLLLVAEPWVGAWLGRASAARENAANQNVISLSLKRGRTGDDENPSFEMANEQRFKVTTISSFNILLISKPPR